MAKSVMAAYGNQLVSSCRRNIRRSGINISGNNVAESGWRSKIIGGNGGIVSIERRKLFSIIVMAGGGWHHVAWRMAGYPQPSWRRSAAIGVIIGISVSA
jgi:hypothetical protein